MVQSMVSVVVIFPYVLGKYSPYRYLGPFGYGLLGAHTSGVLLGDATAPNIEQDSLFVVVSHKRHITLLGSIQQIATYSEFEGGGPPSERWIHYRKLGIKKWPPRIYC